MKEFGPLRCTKHQKRFWLSHYSDSLPYLSSRSHYFYFWFDLMIKQGKIFWSDKHFVQTCNEMLILVFRLFNQVFNRKKIKYKMKLFQWQKSERQNKIIFPIFPLLKVNLLAEFDPTERTVWVPLKTTIFSQFTSLRKKDAVEHYSGHKHVNFG